MNAPDTNQHAGPHRPQSLLRRWLDKAFTVAALLAVLLIVTSLVVILLPMIWRGAGAVVFRGTVEFRKMQLTEPKFHRGDPAQVQAESERAGKARARAYAIVENFRRELDAVDVTVAGEQTRELYAQYKNQLRLKNLPADKRLELQDFARDLRDKLVAAYEIPDKPRAIAAVNEVLRHRDDPRLAGTAMEQLFPLARQYRQALEHVDLARRELFAKDFQEVQNILADMFGPPAGKDASYMPPEKRYGATRWDQAQVLLHRLMWTQRYVAGGNGAAGEKLADRKTLVPREDQFRGTALAALFPYVRDHMDDMFLPRTTFYWQYFYDDSTPGHYFGGVGPEILGTLLLTVLAIAVSLPLGVTAAGYLIEVAGDNIVVRVIRTCINTLAGVPSIVFGLFGLAFFVVYLLPRIGGSAWSKSSVLAGGLTLGILVLPIIIRASEEAIRSVPYSYKEAALGLGASRFRCFVTVTLPAALPGILTGTILSMSRAAGETAPILFTAAVAVGGVPHDLSQPTRTLSYAAYDMAVSDKLAALVPHQQYGMVMTLVMLVLLMNLAAIMLRSRVSKRLRGS